MALQDYKCPNCGGAITFNPSAQELVCPYCDSVIGAEAFKYAETSAQQQESQPQQQATDWNYEGTGWQADAEQDLVVYSCNSCGGEIVGERTMGASTCPFCTNPIVVTATFSGALRPDLIIPFKLDKQYALSSLEHHYQKKILLPKVFKEKNRLQEVKGIYVPFWLYYADTDAYFEYRGQKVRTWIAGNYLYTETQHYQLIREGTIGFDAVPADGSIKIDDTLMESIEPYSLSDATQYNNAYLAGFYANKYDLNSVECAPRVDERVRNSTAAEFMKTTSGFSSVKQVSSNIRIRGKAVYYAMLPVWLLASIWENRSFLFAMNGQTGKFVGDLPVDKTKKWKLFWLMFGIIAAVLMTITQLYVAFEVQGEIDSHIWAGVISVVIALLIPFAIVKYWESKLKSVRPKDYAADYIRYGSFVLRTQQDIFLFRNVTKIPLAQKRR